MIDDDRLKCFDVGFCFWVLIVSSFCFFDIVGFGDFEFEDGVLKF